MSFLPLCYQNLSESDKLLVDLICKSTGEMRQNLIDTLCVAMNERLRVDASGVDERERLDAKNERDGGVEKGVEKESVSQATQVEESKDSLIDLQSIYNTLDFDFRSLACKYKMLEFENDTNREYIDECIEKNIKLEEKYNRLKDYNIKVVSDLTNMRLMSDSINSLQMEIMDLTYENNNLNDTLRQHEYELETRLQTIANLGVQIASMEENIRDLKSEHSRDLDLEKCRSSFLIEKIESLENKLETELKFHKSLNISVEHFKEEVEKLTTQLEDSKYKQKDDEIALNYYRNLNAKLEKELEEARTQLNNDCMLFSQHFNEMNTLRETIRHQSSQIDDYQGDNDAVIREYAILRNERDESAKKYLQMVNVNEEMKLKINDLQEEYVVEQKNLLDTITKQREEKEEMQKKIDELQKKHDEMKTNLDSRWF